MSEDQKQTAIITSHIKSTDNPISFKEIPWQYGVTMAGENGAGKFAQSGMALGDADGIAALKLVGQGLLEAGVHNIKKLGHILNAPTDNGLPADAITDVAQNKNTSPKR